jgi:serine/threonine protein kinase
MGEVYRAHDSRLEREVAIKILHADRVADPERRRRFLQEAKAASALNHSNIVHIYDIGRSGDTDFIAMEYVPGKTLDRLATKKDLPLKEILSYSVQIADALATAHSAGIVHRDLKPANIMVTGRGSIKVLDFGVAKLVEREPGEEGTTLTLEAETCEGALVGTIAYMSPEQAEGKKVDARSDIFSFGVLLYELLTGRQAFSGDSNLSILAAILREEPLALSRTRNDIPRDLERIVRRCLRKDPARRFQVMQDVKLALEEVEDDDRISSPKPVQSRMRRALPLIVTGLVVAASVSLAFWRFIQPLSREPAYTFRPLATEPEDETWPAWSFDGNALAYVVQVNGIQQIFARTIGAATSTQLTRAGVDCDFPFWHPDGTRIFYNSEGGLWSVRVTGGQPVLVLENVQGGSISPDGKTLAFVRGGDSQYGLWIASLSGGEPRQYLQDPFPKQFREVDGTSQVQFSRDGSKIGISVSRMTGGGGDEFWVVPFPSGTPRLAITTKPVRRFSWLPDNTHFVFDAGRREVSGTHLFLADTASGAILPITSGTGQESHGAVSPDGARIAFASGGTDFDLIETSFEGGPVRSLLATSRMEQTPGWAPSGTQYAYFTDATGFPEIWLRSSVERWSQPIVGRTGVIPDFALLQKPRFSPDAQSVAYEARSKDHTIWISTIAGSRPVRLDSETSDQHGPSWSPDGNFISYWRLQGEKWFVTKIAIGGGAAVSLTGTNWGAIPMGLLDTAWSPSGDWICYNGGDRLHLISADGMRRKALPEFVSQDFSFSKDGATVYALRQTANKRWEMAIIDVESATERRAVPIDVPTGARLSGLTIHPGGKTFATSVGKSTHDIWLMEGLQVSTGIQERWRRKPL